MGENDNMFSSDEDDDILLELGSRPPRATQILPLDTQVIAPQPIEVSQTGRPQKSSPTNELQDKLNAALGEASLLRDKLSLIDHTRKQDEESRKQALDKINEAHKIEENKLKQTIQRLEDEKKFQAINIKTAAVATAYSSPATPISGNSSRIRSSNQRQRVTHAESGSSPIVKKRKVTEPAISGPKSAPVVPLTFNRVTRDESSDFFDAIMTHKTIGTDVTTMDILSKIKLENIGDCGIRGNYNILKTESVGKFLTLLFMDSMRTLPLDQSVDMLLENTAILIKEVSFNDTESKVSVPFLIEIMFQIISFRPSAVNSNVLKDTFSFSCDLIRKYQFVLKEPLVTQPDEHILQPQIFQFELIHQLIIFNTFDLLEMATRILQSHIQSHKVLSAFFDKTLLNLLDQIYTLALPMSFKMNIRVAINMVEILSAIANMQESLKATQASSNGKPDFQIIPPSWWETCVARLLSIFKKDVPSASVNNEEDPNIMFFNQYHDSFGLIRNIGNNSISQFIPKLIDSTVVRSQPMVISKDDVDAIIKKDGVDFEFEQWGFILKRGILNILGSLLNVYTDDVTVLSYDILSTLTMTMAKEQEYMLQRIVGQNSPNIMLHQELVEDIIVIVFHIWTKYREKISDTQMKGLHNDLLMSLWRVIVSNNNIAIDPKRSRLDIEDHSRFVDSLASMSLQDDTELYEDAFEFTPDYIMEELDISMEQRCLKIMQVKFGEPYIAMAREMFESEINSLGPIEFGDSLYMAMGL